MNNLKEFDDAYKELEIILDGIDRSEIEYTHGWWATFSGAEFGEKRKHEIIGLFKKHLQIIYDKGVYDTRM